MINIWCHQILRSCLTRPYSYSSLITTSNNKGNSIISEVFEHVIACLAGDTRKKRNNFYFVCVDDLKMMAWNFAATFSGSMCSIELT